jgi:transcriptional regulator with XRE-family HTH domain
VVRRFAARLKTLRKERGMSQEEVAQRSKLHPTTISALERGLYIASLVSLDQLAHGLGVDIAALVSFPDESKGTSKPNARDTEKTMILMELEGFDAQTLRKIRKALQLFSAV